jgi:hypothetical protein
MKDSAGSMTKKHGTARKRNQHVPPGSGQDIIIKKTSANRMGEGAHEEQKKSKGRREEVHENNKKAAKSAAALPVVSTEIFVYSFSPLLLSDADRICYRKQGG